MPLVTPLMLFGVVPYLGLTGKMTALAAIGYCLFAFGPITALFFGTVACNPHEVILLILG